MHKKKIIILCGGPSAEHEISIRSTRCVLSGLHKQKFDIAIIYVSRQGQWYLIEDLATFVDSEDAAVLSLAQQNPLLLQPGCAEAPLVLAQQPEKSVSVDCFFPMIHGTFGEDGALQGLLNSLNVPYVGCDICATAVAMEKYIAKQLLRAAGLPVVDWMLVSDQHNLPNYADVVTQLGVPFFVKPSAMGSSIGVSKISHQQQYESAVKQAFLYAERVLLEKTISGREIECAVLGNEKPMVALPGEVITRHDFYSYEAKYIDEDGAAIVSPAELSAQQVEQLQNLSIRAHQILLCSGMSRVDFLMSEDGEYYINEVNTIPGFTNISLFPKNWQSSGMGLTELLSRLIQLAEERFAKKNALLCRYQKVGELT